MKKEHKPPDLAAEVKHLSRAVHQLPKRHRYVLHPWYIFLSGLLRGIGHSVGILLAIAIVIPLTIAVLNSINWVPLIGDFISDIAQRLQTAP